MNRNHSIVIVFCAAVALVFAVVFTNRDVAEPTSVAAMEPVVEPLSEAVADPSAPRTVRIEAVGEATAPVPSGATLVVSRSSLGASPQFAVKLQLAQPEDSGEPLTGRILTEGRALDLSAAVIGDASDVAQVEIDADWLTPGRYVIEVHTSERSHFPLRRYALEVE